METTELTGTFNLRNGFYVIMGGLSLDVGHLQNGISKARLAAKGPMALAKGTSLMSPQKPLQIKAK